MVSTAILLIILACVLPLPPLSEDDIAAILDPDLDYHARKNNNNP